MRVYRCIFKGASRALTFLAVLLLDLAVDAEALR